MKAGSEADTRKYWIGVVSRAHILRGIQGGFIQLNHGKIAPLKRFRPGDGLIIYSPRLSYPDGEPCQAFTAVGKIKSGDIYQVDMGDGFQPYRLDVDYLPCRETPIRPLIGRLSFITNKGNWGAGFRFGYRRIPEEDFALIAESMGCDFAGAFPAGLKQEQEARATG
jgi:hypothetical protein